ncbi:hypothetical protein AAE478_004328 [Parahypoxylon ruwenzoriense]
MPPRKRKDNGAVAKKPSGAVRKSTRISKDDSLIPNDSSSDELSSRNPVLLVDRKSTETRGSGLEEDIVDEITVSTSYLKPRKSSRPSTANSEAISLPRPSRSSPVPAKKEEIKVLGVHGDEVDELAGDGPATKKSKSSKTQEAPTGSARKGKSKYDNPDEMLTNPRAPLATAKLRDLLCSSKAWDVLSLDEKQAILSKFPDTKEVLDAGTENARPNVLALRNNDNFRYDVAHYQEDLAKGCHDPEWIRQAQNAHRKRELGFYDDYLSARFKEDWDMDMPGREDNGQKNEEEHEDAEMSMQVDNAPKNEEERPDTEMSLQEDTVPKNSGESPDKMSIEEDTQKDSEQHPYDIKMD